MSINNQHKPGYKHTPLGWVPKEWELKEVSEVCNIINGRGFKPHEWKQSGLPIIRIQNLNGSKEFNFYEGEYDNKILVENGQLLFAWSGSKGTSFGPHLWTGNSGLLNYHTWKINIKEDLIYKDFFFHFLKFLTVKIENRAHGASALVHTQKGEMEQFEVFVPPAPEQRKIATILSTWDEAITKTQQLISQLQQRNKGLMQLLLTAKDNWKEKKLSDVFDRVVRKNTNGNANVITISAQRGFVKQNDFFKKLVASETLDNYFLVRKGEFCYNKSYSNGYDWGATKRLNDFDEAVVTTLYICFRIKNENEYFGEYFEYFFDANILDRGLAQIAHEGGRAHGLLNVIPSDFFNLKIHVPPYDEQLRIFKILSAARNELKLTEYKFAVLQQQKKGLMQKLLTGEVRVNID